MNFTSLTTRDGLSSNTVNAILKDRYGLLWFATEDGLNKFDGTNFTVYRYAPGNLRSLQSNEILSLHEDAGGNLWVGTSGGYLSMYDRSTDAFIFYGDTTITNNVIRSICSDASGNIWAAHLNGVSIINPKTKVAKSFTFPVSGAPFIKVCNSLFLDINQQLWIGSDEGLYSYDLKSKKLSHYLHSDVNPKSIANNSIRYITEDKNHNMWIGTDVGLSRMIGGTTDFINYFSKENDPNSLTNNSINAVAADNSNRLWVATANGINQLDLATGSIRQLKFDAHKENWLNTKNISCVYIDDQDICWLGTFRGGINKYNSNQNLISLVKSNPFDATGLPSPLVTSFAASDNNKIFIGTDGGGLSEFNPASGTFRHIKLQTKLSKTEKKLVILSLLKTSGGELLAGTFADGLFIINPATGSYRQLTKGNSPADLNANEIFCITEDHSGNRWLGTNGNGINVLDRENKIIVRYTPNPVLPNDRKLDGNGFIRDIKEDRNGNMWVATHGGGMLFFNAEKKTFTVYTPEKDNVPNGKVTSVLIDGNNNVWVGTQGGLGLFDPGTQKFSTISELNGLPNNTVCKLLQDDRGMLWLSTNKGLSMYNPANKKFSNFTYHNGVQRSNFITGAGIKSPDGAIYFGGQEGFNFFNPAQLKKSFSSLNVILTDLKISNKSVLPSEEGPIKENISIAKRIDLNYKQNFALSFVGINYSTPEQNVYAYKLAGFDRDWNYTGSSNTASYTNLDPGEYTFFVKSSNGGDLWDGPVTAVKIYVHPPFWRTIWAYIIYALIVTGTLFFIRYRSIKKIQGKYLAEQEKMQAAHERKEVERLHELDQLKLKFLTNLSHEFRTPISLILGPVDTLLTKQKAEQEATQLNMIKRNAKRLLNLVNQLLDFRKMEEHELKLQLKEGELIHFVKEVADSFLDLSERKKIAFSFSADTEAFYTAFDHDKIERIIFNLLSNAFKFTPEGGKISFTVSRDSSSPPNGDSWLSFEFRDTGIGIPADKKETIFERFFQTAATGSILNQGTGIGLSITKEFVKMQGGHIEVESEVNKGSCFYVRLPFAEIKKQPEQDDTGILPPAINQEQPVDYTPVTGTVMPAETNNGNLPLILLVEDNDDFRFYLKENLRLQYKVVEASNGQDGWQRTLAAHPKLVVSDIQMPGMDGIELCKKIKADKRTGHIPVILLTALSGEQAQLSGLQTGASDYITKPFNFEILNAKIRNLLALNDTLKTTYSKQIELLAPPVELTSGSDKLLQTIAIYIEENIADPQLSVENLSRHVGMSRSSLYSKLLELTGQTPVEFIRSVKLNKAAQLLEKSDMTVAEIAYSVGFSTPNYFAKSFKTKFGLLPSEYIAKMRKLPGSEDNK